MREKSYKCLICSDKFPRKECVEIKYRYGSGKGQIGTTHMCTQCSNTNLEEGDETYDESV